MNRICTWHLWSHISIEIRCIFEESFDALLMTKSKQYSALAIAVIACKSVDGQYTYTDIDDISIYSDPFGTDSVNIDLDFNGVPDFALRISRHSQMSYNTAYSEFYWNELVEFHLLPLNDLNGAMASNPTSFPFLPHPYLMENGDLVNASQSFSVAANQILAKGSYHTNDNFWHNTSGNWGFGEDIGYLGLRFIDETDCFHYGWLRLNIDTAFRAYSIAYWAYQETCNKGVIVESITGDTVVSTNQIIPNDCIIYDDAINVYIQLNEQEEKSILVYSTSGSVVMKICSPDNLIALSKAQLTKGVYLLKINCKNQFYSRLISIY